MGGGMVFSFVLKCYSMFCLLILCVVAVGLCLRLLFADVAWGGVFVCVIDFAWFCYAYVWALLFVSLGPLSNRCLGSSDAVLVIGRR